MKSDGTTTKLERLNALLEHTWKHNAFYLRKWRAAGFDFQPFSALKELGRVPFTTRAELLADQAAGPPLGTNLGCPLSAIINIVCSSGSSGASILWGDTLKSWEWVTRCSQELYALAGIQPTDRILFSPSSGASSGRSIQHTGAQALGCACLPGESSPRAQFERMRDFRPTLLVGKPSRLLALAGTVQQAGESPDAFGVRKLILTGEPSRQGLRPQLERIWGAECFDRYGMTEAGSIASECAAHSGGMHLLGSEYIAEVLCPESNRPAAEGQAGELVLTNLGRIERPIIRYRTGDIVRLVPGHCCECGRAEPMLMGDVVRGNAGTISRPEAHEELVRQTYSAAGIAHW